MNLNDIIPFIKLLHLFQSIERQIHVKGRAHKENDAEHSYQLAMFAWFVAETYFPKLNKTKVLKYALIHDLVESYAGDTYLYGKNSNPTTKIKKEKKAAERLEKEFPMFTELHSLIHSYETKKDKESKYVYVLDKILPSITIYLDKGRSWKINNISLEKLIDMKSPKIQAFPELIPLFDDLIATLQKNKKTLFTK